MKMVRLVITIVVSALPGVVYSINKCTDALGNVSYQELPCDQSADTEVMKNLGITPDWKLKPEVSLMVSERTPGVVHRVGHESITVVSDYTVVGVDYRVNPIRIWDGTVEEREAILHQVDCQTRHTHLRGELADYARERAAVLPPSLTDDRGTKDRVIKAVDSEYWYVLNCTVSSLEMDEAYTSVNIPDEDSCPTLWSRRYGTAPAAHIALFSDQSLVILSLPLQGEC